MLHLPNNQTVKYMLITTETKTDSMIGKGLMDRYNELIAKLDQILKLIQAIKITPYYLLQTR